MIITQSSKPVNLAEGGTNSVIEVKNDDTATKIVAFTESLGYGRTSQWSKREHPSGWQTDQEAREDVKTGMYRATWNLQQSFFGNGGGNQ